ncbi:MAG: response regulator, partial [Isosphaeraceae bacterium]|nr:response regulator [Isosphaeraceae bacterium]
GSTFRLELGAIPAPAPAAPLPADGPDLRPLDQPLRVLLVEDNQDTAIVLARLLRGRGHTVTTAANLSDALAAAEAGDFDLVLSDLGLPDGSGLELLHQLRRRSPAVRGIVLSGYGMDADVRRSHEAGYAAHLTKPLDFAKLEETIRRVTS